MKTFNSTRPARSFLSSSLSIGLLAASAWGTSAIAQSGPQAPVASAAADASAAPTPASSASGSARPAAATAAAASGLRPFADIVKDARRVDGLFTVWQKDDKVWLELKPSDLDQPFFLSPKARTGIGEARFYGGLMADEVVVEFRRVHNQLQLLARNTEFVA